MTRRRASGRARPRPEARTAAMYLRVSKGEQTTKNQRPDVERIVRARKLELVDRYDEQVSAAAKRPEFERMMADARAGRFRVLVVWALDRFGRSMVGNLGAVLELDRLGVEVISVREPWLDTGGPVRALLIAIFSWVAEQERARIGERTRAGLERARRRGTKLGRPRRAFMITELEQARRLAAKGMALRKIARRLRVPNTTLHRALRGGALITTMSKRTVSPRETERLGWKRIDRKPWTKLNARWQHARGWTLHHCGHPTANTPWDLHDAKGARHLTGALRGDKKHGTAWPNLASAMDYVASTESSFGVERDRVSRKGGSLREGKNR
jgi:putative DNA-invertase from lambdoid prophage Rac